MNDVATLAKEIARKNFEAGGPRECRVCHDEFMAEGIQTVCNSCSGRMDKRAKGEWHESWPLRARKDLETFTGEPLDKARANLDVVLKKRGTLALIGDRGRGKTVMATWRAQKRMEIGRSCGVYVRVHDLFATIRRAWHAQSKEDEWQVLEHYRNAKFLVIDEFQERSESEWENRTLVNILDHRHADMLPTLIIANLSPQDFAKHVGPSILDRIAQTGGIVQCTWGSFR